jgi:hypothetical protein
MFMVLNRVHNFLYPDTHTLPIFGGVKEEGTSNKVRVVNNLQFGRSRCQLVRRGLDEGLRRGVIAGGISTKVRSLRGDRAN